jgi:hypothetical protein
LRFVGAGSEHTLLLERARESVESLRAAAPSAVTGKSAPLRSRFSASTEPRA